jgi:hypothetical protein
MGVHKVRPHEEPKLIFQLSRLITFKKTVDV